MHGAIGVLAALVARNQTGRGQYVDISMMDGSLRAAGAGVLDIFRQRQNSAPRRDDQRRRHSELQRLSVQGRQIHYDRGDRAVVLRQPVPRARPRRFHSARIRFEQARGNRAACFTETFKTRTRDEWFEILSKSDICVGRMLTLDEVPNDPQVQARNMIVEVEGEGGRKFKQVGISAKFSDTPGIDQVARAATRPAYRRNPRRARLQQGRARPLARVGRDQVALVRSFCFLYREGEDGGEGPYFRTLFRILPLLEHRREIYGKLSYLGTWLHPIVGRLDRTWFASRLLEPFLPENSRGNVVLWCRRNHRSGLWGLSEKPLGRMGIGCLRRD